MGRLPRALALRRALSVDACESFSASQAHSVERVLALEGVLSHCFMRSVRTHAHMQAWPVQAWRASPSWLGLCSFPCPSPTLPPQASAEHPFDMTGLDDVFFELGEEFNVRGGGMCVFCWDASETRVHRGSPGGRGGRSAAAGHPSTVSSVLTVVYTRVLGHNVCRTLNSWCLPWVF
jgi:hypothetical protein